ncbi:MAG: hypothetical protein HUJ60_03325 [Bacilli bacterium]|nr:hypothetical protein [Bacilli bacterium]
MKEDAYRFLGLLNRGGKVAVGDAVLTKMRKGDALLLADSSSQTQARIKEKGERTGVLLLLGADSEELGAALGFPRLTAALVCDQKAARRLKTKWEEKEKEA